MTTGSTLTMHTIYITWQSLKSPTVQDDQNCHQLSHFHVSRLDVHLFYLASNVIGWKHIILWEAMQLTAAWTTNMHLYHLHCSDTLQQHTTCEGHSINQDSRAKAQWLTKTQKCQIHVVLSDKTLFTPSVGWGRGKVSARPVKNLAPIPKSSSLEH